MLHREKKSSPSQVPSFFSARNVRAITAVVLLLATTLTSFGATAEAENPASPQHFYNDGTQKFRTGKLPEAEVALQNAVASQNEKVQSAALYNLGHVRFQQGAQELKTSPNGKATAAATKPTRAAGEAAIRAADDALLGWDVQAMVSAYQRGRGTRKQLKEASEAVKRAMETYGAVLSKWQRASGDFKGANELRPSDADAQANAEVVDRSIAQLVDTQQIMMQSKQGMGKQSDELRQKMKELKERMPEQERKQCENGEEEDEEKPGKEPQPGMEEPKSKDGKARPLTPEQAGRLLDMLKLDGNRKLPLGPGETAQSKDRKRRDW